ncbi:MAG: hypothetical protein H0X24_06620 [Ktedonobacterales bacterium]|nr:hypothetical protein [Ktedonobacterales bacterium]
MQTVVGHFSTIHDMDVAIQRLSAIQLGEMQEGTKGPDGVHEQHVASGLEWDAIAQLCIVGGIVLGGFFGLLAGRGVFGGIPHSALSAQTAWAGVLVGGSMGLLAGFIVGVLWGIFAPEKHGAFQPTSAVGEEYLVTVQTNERWVSVAENIMHHAHARRVENRQGRIDLQSLAA